MVYKTVHYKDVDGYEQWYELDDKGNMIHIRESNGFEKWYEYDDKGNCIYSKNSDGLEQWNKFDNNGKKVYFRNSEGREVWITYDEKGNEIRHKYSLGPGKFVYDRRTLREYDDKGHVIHVKEVWLKGFGEDKKSGAFEEWREYDEKGNCIYCKDSNGHERWNKYDEKGNKIFSESVNGTKEWYEYDDNGNMIHSKDSDGYEIRKEYDEKGNCIHFRNSDLFEQWHEFNEDGNEIHFKSISGGDIVEFRIEYDDKGNKVRKIMNDGNQLSWEYGEREVTRELTDTDISMLRKLEHDTLYFEKWFDGSSIRDEIRYQYGADLKAEANDAKKPGVSKEQKREAKPDGLHYVLGLEDVAVLRDLEMVRQHFGEDFDSYFRKYECNFIDNCTYNGKSIGDRKGFDDIISGKADEVKVSYPAEYEGKKVFGMDDWTGSFHEQFKPGDLVNVEIVTEMRDCVPPVSHSPVYVQCGEPYSHKMNKDGKMAPTFATFESVSNNIHDADSVWRYCGTCFEGEHQEAKDYREEKRKVADKISDVLKDMEGKKSLSKAKKRSCGMEM